MKSRRCPTCKTVVPASADPKAFPFCSLRCKTVDLGSWLDERYRLASADSPSEDELEGSS